MSNTTFIIQVFSMTTQKKITANLNIVLNTLLMLIILLNIIPMTTLILFCKFHYFLSQHHHEFFTYLNSIIFGYLPQYILPSLIFALIVLVVLPIYIIILTIKREKKLMLIWTTLFFVHESLFYVYISLAARMIT